MATPHASPPPPIDGKLQYNTEEKTMQIHSRVRL
jgi:hypothetical protein